ncbi:MAG TPA: AAA family ATPase [Acidimicrobiales bacterium]|nr:AAA family ATPase [Acidimicrobiales bacterium]
MGSELVGRENELRLGEEALDALRSGSPAFLAVLGQPGIGKTRLLAELTREAETRGYLALGGRGGELERDLPFGVVADALDAYVAGLGPVLDDLPSDTLVHLAAVLPSVGPPGGGTDMLQEERYRAFRAVRALIELLAARRPLVLALDDLHWADPASVELLSYLLRHPPAAPVLFLLALRPHQAPTRLHLVLDAATREGAVTRLELGPLTSGEAEALMGAGVDAAQRQALYRESGGNPFFLEELLRTGRHRAGSEQEAAVIVEEVPAGVVAVISQELALLSSQATLVLRAGAVAGDPFELDLAAEIAELDEEEVLEPLDELFDAGLLQPTGVPRRFRFRHPIVRRAVYTSAGRGWRLAAHRRAADALAARGAPAAARAHHVARSARTGDLEAVSLLSQAGESVAVHAPVTAAEWFAAAIRLLPEGEREAARRIQLLAARATALGASGRLEEAREALLETLALIPPDQTSLHVRLTAVCAAVEHLLGLHVEARNRLRRALEELSDARSPDAVTLHLELSADGLWMSDFDGMRTWAMGGLALASDIGDRLLIAAATLHLAYAECCEGDITGATQHLAEATELFVALPDDELASRLDTAMHLGYCSVLMGRFSEAERHVTRGLALARSTGQGALLKLMTTALAWATSAQGRLAEALELAERASESSRLTGNAQELSFALGLQSWIAALAGHTAEAGKAAEESLTLAPRLERSVISAAAGWTVAASIIERGEPGRAAEVILQRVGGPDLPLVAPSIKCLCYEILTRAELGRGRLVEAEEWARRAESFAERLGLPFADIFARRASAEVALERGDHALAVDHARASARAAEGVGARLDAARARVLAGRALAASSDREPAVAELVTAAEELSVCGAVHLAGEAAAVLRRLGHRVPAPGRVEDRGPLPGLSRREAEIAELIYEGMTNREIAAKLFVSERTVESHVAHILAKLGVSSRTAVAALIADARRAVPSP